jgi:replicative DNA helicase
VKNHIFFTGNTPVVIIDYLQILAPTDPRSTDKQNTDKAVLELKRLSRDYKIPVLAISSFNREAYSGAVTMASFKESGAIEYSSDVLIGLQFEGIKFSKDGQKNLDHKQVEELYQADPRRIELKILKNRKGRLNDAVPFRYYPRFNYFIEG